MNPLLTNARKLFVEITRRTTVIKNSIHSLYYSSLCSKYANHGDPVELFNQKQNLISWTSQISTLVSKNKPRKSFNLFKMMLLNEQSPNYVTVLSVIRAISLLNYEDLLWEIHGFVVKMGFEVEVSVVTALIGVYSEFHMSNVWKLFDEMPSKDDVLWSAMISACVRNMEYVNALELFKKMQCYDIEPNYICIVSILPACANLGVLAFGKQIHGFSIKRMFYSHTNVQNSLLNMYAKCRSFDSSIQIFSDNSTKDLISWKTIIHGCVENERPKRAISIFSKMQFSGFEPTETIILDIIGAILQEDMVKFGVSFHCYLLKSGFLTFVSVGTSLLQMYAKFGDIGLAEILFHQLCQKDFIAWSAMISTYAQNERPLDAINTFKYMASTSQKSNAITFVSLLQACSSMRAQEHGESIHAHVVKVGYVSNSFITSALIDLYCKLGKINLGVTLFDETRIKDLICWSSMINGYGVNGYGYKALETFSDMLNSAIKPNDIVFISVLSACSHCGLEREGLEWFYTMEDKYGVTPKRAHYSCIVDLLSRNGNLEEALTFVNKMPLEPDKRIWGALLAGCRLKPGTVKIAEIATKQLIRFDPQNTSYYVNLSNMYADEGIWAEAERLRSLVDEKGLKKITGCSAI